MFLVKNTLEHNLNIPKLNKLELIVFDFDGVLTDNKVITFENGLEGVIVNRSDGLAASLFKKNNIPLLILSTEKNNVVQVRAKKIGVECMNSISNKKEALVNYCTKNCINLENVIYVGNDINDLEVMKIVGWPICPKDAYPEIINISKIVLEKDGGDGIIRELYNLLLNGENRYEN